MVLWLVYHCVMSSQLKGVEAADGSSSSLLCDKRDDDGSRSHTHTDSRSVCSTADEGKVDVRFCLLISVIRTGI